MWTNEQISTAGIVSGYAPRPILAPATPVAQVGARSARLPTALLGVPFDNLTLAETLDRIDDMIASGRPHYAVTANVDFCVQSLEDVELRRILVDAHLVLCDGTPLVWASKLFGNPLPERVAGADLVPKLIKRASEKGHRIFFLGGAAHVTQQAVQRLQTLHPGVVIAGHYSPPFRPLLDMDHDEIVERIRAARPDLLFVSFGCPKAEKWMAMHYRTLGVPLAIGVGATIDFLAGNVRRAPNWMQRSGLEWLFRLAQEPGRLWSRYAKDLRQVGWPLLSQLHLQRSSRRRSTTSRATVTASDSTWVRVQAPPQLDHASLLSDAAIWDGARCKDCILDLSEVSFMDSSGLAALVRLRQRVAPCSLVLLAPSAPVLRILRRFKLEDFFRIAPTILEARELLSRTQRPAAAAAFANRVPPIFWSDEVTAANAEDVWTETRKQIDLLCAAGEKQPAIDLAELRFIDSSGVGLMLRARRYAQNLGVQLRFINARAGVLSVLRMAKLESLLLQQ